MHVGGLATARLLGHRVVCDGWRPALDAVLARARTRAGGAACFANVHMLVEGLRDRRLRAAMAGADWVFPDGMPLVLALRALGRRGCARVAGMDAVPALLTAAEREGLAVAVYGGAPDTLAALRARLAAGWPRLELAMVICPPFRPLSAEEEAVDAARLEASGAHLVLVGLGCPKQELWIARNRARTGAVLLGVGAALATTAGTLAMAPQWARDAGLEWVHRLLQEPGRLWRRYASTNPRFVNLVLRQLWSR